MVTFDTSSRPALSSKAYNSSYSEKKCVIDGYSRLPEVQRKATVNLNVSQFHGASIQYPWEEEPQLSSSLSLQMLTKAKTVV